MINCLYPYVALCRCYYGIITLYPDCLQVFVAAVFLALVSRSLVQDLPGQDPVPVVAGAEGQKVHSDITI